MSFLAECIRHAIEQYEADTQQEATELRALLAEVLEEQSKGCVRRSL